MSVDQTFHTPSFGDEEFDILPANYENAPNNVFGNQVPVDYLKRKLSCDQIQIYSQQQDNYSDCQLYNNQYSVNHLRPPESHLQQQQQSNQQGGYLVHNSPQGHVMNNNQFQQQSYHQNMMGSQHIGMQQMQYDNYSDMPTSPHHQQQMQMNFQQQHMQPQQQMYSTLNQSQISNQLGLQQQMAMQQQGGSPPGSNHNSPSLESSEDSDDSTPLAQLMGSKKLLNPEPVDVPKVIKKPKPQKKKKKKDPNEPQKPVSAYALFFRDTQAAIKGQSPNASFGEVSKIVASMWDSLDIDRKNSYKKKTETAKKEYLKALAAYRANLVSKQCNTTTNHLIFQAAVDQSDSTYTSSPPRHSPPSNTSPPSHMMGMAQKQSPVLTSVVDSMQPVAMGMHEQQQQVWHMQSPPQMQSNSPPRSMQQQHNNNMHQLQQQQQQPAMLQQQQPHMSPQQQMMNQSPPMIATSPQQQMANSPTYMQNMSVSSSLPTCLRNGCSNVAIDSPDWDREYCSSECVVSHCKDVFATWVAQRQVSNPYSVK